MKKDQNLEDCKKFNRGKGEGMELRIKAGLAFRINQVVHLAVCTYILKFES